MSFSLSTTDCVNCYEHTLRVSIPSYWFDIQRLWLLLQSLFTCLLNRKPSAVYSQCDVCIELGLAMSNYKVLSEMCGVYSQLGVSIHRRENLLIPLASLRLAKNVFVRSVGERHPTLRTVTFLASRVG